MWQPPENGFFKLNIDGAPFSDFQVAGIGVILRDSYGEVVFAVSMKEQDV